MATLATNSGSLARDYLAAENHSLTVIKLSCFLLLVVFLNKAAIVLSLSGLACAFMYYVEYTNHKQANSSNLPFNLKFPALVIASLLIVNLLIFYNQ